MRAIGRLNKEYSVDSKQHWQNVAAAYTVARHLGVPLESSIEGINSFGGIPHRQEKVLEVKGVDYINDSKATNTAAVKIALQNYDNIYWILGGRFKEEHMDVLLPCLDKVRQAFIIGESMEHLSRLLQDRTDITKSKTLDQAVIQARAAAQASGAGKPVVLFSPACESFDQFKNFEHRGEMFKSYVQEVA